MKRMSAVLLVALSASACFDFADPDFPEAGAPAVMQVTVFADDAGATSVEGVLAPGLREGGDIRTVSNDTLRVSDMSIVPTEVRKNGSRTYSASSQRTQPLRRVTIQPPRIAEVGTLPVVDWRAIQRSDADTVEWTRGTDLVLHVANDADASTPAPQIRQWFMDLTGSDRQFRISSDGFPPDTLRIPSDWVPATAGGILLVHLSYYQSGRQQSPAGDYIELSSYTFQLHWTVRVKGS